MKKLFAIIAFVVCFFICSSVFSEEIVVAFEKKEYSVLAGKTISVTPVIQGTKQHGKYSYSSSDESIATVNNGKVKGITPGEAVISCLVIVGENSFECSYILHVDQPVTEIVISESEFILPADSAIRTSVVTVLPENANNKELEFSSTNESVGFAYEDGKIVARRHGGTATITCKATDGSGVTAKFKITVPKVAWVSVPNDIIIDTPEGIEFFYIPTYDQSYNTSEDYCSNDVIVEKMDSDRGEQAFKQFMKTQPFKMNNSLLPSFVKVHLLPQKVGKGKFIIRVNGRSGAINVTVAREAVYEALKYADYAKKAKEGLRYSVSGTVMKYDDESDSSFYLAMDDDEINTVKILLSNPTSVSEGDSITVKGIYNNMTDFITETGLSKSIPEISAETIIHSNKKE